MRGVFIVTGLLLIVVGFVLVFAGMLAGSGEAEAGGVIMIGPIPIAFGTSRRMAMGAMLLAALLMILWLILFVLSVKR